MKRSVFVAVLAGAVALGTVQAQQRGDGPATQRPTAGQPTVAPSPPVPDEAMVLGTIRLPRAVRANNQVLPAGTYQVRVTTETASPTAVGITENYERWAEFVQGGQVRGREVLSVVPQEEIRTVAEDAIPAPGGSKVQMLAGGDYWRIWFNQGGTHYLIHLPPA